VTSPFLESYAGQSTEELLALEGKYRIDSLVLAFEQANDEPIADLLFAWIKANRSRIRVGDG
jgi:hypothetical protein